MEINVNIENFSEADFTTLRKKDINKYKLICKFIAKQTDKLPNIREVLHCIFKKI